MVLSWSLTEVVRYSFYAFSLLGSEPAPLAWLRYTLFYVLYPTGASSEAFLMYSTLPHPAWGVALGTGLVDLRAAAALARLGDLDRRGLLDGVGRRLGGRPVEEDRLRAFGRECLGDGRAETAGGAGDDDDGVAECLHGFGS